MPSDKFRQRNPKNKQTKYQLMFDEESRNEFLTGFQRRKKARKKLAQEQVEEKRKEGRRKERQQKREALEEELKSIRLPELHKDTDTDKDPVIYDHPEHTVTITSVTSIDLVKEHGGIGENKVDYGNVDESKKDDDEKDEGTVSTNEDDDVNEDHGDDEEANENEVNTKEAKSKRNAMFEKKRWLKKKQAMRRKRGICMIKRMKSMKKKTVGKFLRRGAGNRRPKR